MILVWGKQKINKENRKKIQSQGSDLVPVLFLQTHSLYFLEGTRKKGDIKWKKQTIRKKI